ncbi:MAG: hypothetical protein WD749_06735 [Phycisphaerales bacterium]
MPRKGVLAVGKSGRSERVLAAGVVLSALAHVAFLAGVVRIADGEVLKDGPGGPAANVLAEPDLPPEEREPERREVVVKLGIEREETVPTMTWLGHEEASEHAARLGPTEQAAFSIQPGSGRELGPQPAPAPTVAAPEARVEPSRTEAPEVAPTTLSHAQAEAGSAAAPAEADEREREARERAARDRRAAVDAAMAELGERLADVLAELASPAPPRVRATPEAAPAPAPAREAPPPPPPLATEAAAATPMAVPVPPEAGAGKPGLASERESMATAVKSAPLVKPGQVVAAKGLEILTREARWSKTTLLTRRPKNPTVSITFGRDGRVRRADFVTVGERRYSTGFDDVDQPLLNAIYSWTARGAPLGELPEGEAEGGAEAGITVVITIVLG